MKIENQRLAVAKRYFGKHFVPGVAGGYAGEDSTIYINQDTAKKMNTTFQGRAVYVQHVQEINPDEKDGVVVRAFYNAKDGQHWVEFLVDTEEGVKHIEQKKWRLSNAYHATEKGPGGEWNGIRYDQEITGAEYEHLAIVEHPRYDESIILTPEQFEEYNNSKETDLKRFLNSKEKEGEKTMFNLFKKTKVENSKDLEGMSVELPISKVQMTLEQVINSADAVEVEKKKPAEERMANGEDMVDCFGGKMKVNDLIKGFNAYKIAEDNMKNESEDESDEDTATNASEEEDKKKATEADEPESGKKNSKTVINENGFDFYNQLKKAPEKAAAKQNATVIKTSSDKVARGKELFGSQK